jgi:hypothetical protein
LVIGIYLEFGIWLLEFYRLRYFKQHGGCNSRMSEPIVVLVTCGSEEEAIKIAHALVEDHLAACVNLVFPIRSIYRWEGKIWDEKECLLVIKTQK